MKRFDMSRQDAAAGFQLHREDPWTYHALTDRVPDSGGCCKNAREADQEGLAETEATAGPEGALPALVHLQDYKQAMGMDFSLCGAAGRTMSHHELKRRRITCDRCILLYHLPPVSGGTASEPYGSQVSS